MATYTSDDGTRIHYRMKGSGGPPLVFVHGWCSRLEHWDAPLRHFSRKQRVLALDRRGHGASDAPAYGYSAEQHGADLAGVLRCEAIDAAVVVAHAGGAASALELACGETALVRALVFVDARIAPAARLGDPDDPAGAALESIAAGLEGPGGAAELEAMYRGFFSEHAGSVGEQAVADALQTPLSVAAAEIRSLALDTQALARRVSQPVLWLTVGAADRAAIRSAFSDVRFDEFADTGHFPHLEVPERFAAMLEEFLSHL